MKTPVNVAITGAAGQIGYALAFRVASGQMLGTDTPVNLHLLEITPALGALQGVVMELNDCAFPTLNRIVATDDAKVAFKDCHVALLVGARPRGPGMERKDLLLANAQIFSAQGKALDAVADRNVRGMMRYWTTTPKLADEVRANSMTDYLLFWYRSISERCDRRNLAAAPRTLRIALVSSVVAGLFLVATWCTLAWLAATGRVALALAATAFSAMAMVFEVPSGIAWIFCRRFNLNEGASTSPPMAS